MLSSQSFHESGDDWGAAQVSFEECPRNGLRL